MYKIVTFSILLIIMGAIVILAVRSAMRNITFFEWEVDDGDVDDGEENDPKQWECSFQEEVALTHYVYPYMIPRFVPNMTLPEDPIFAYTETGKIYALNFTDGSVMWDLDFASAFSHDPAIFGESLFVYTADSIISLDPVNGTENWEVDVSGFGHIPPSYTTDSIFIYTNQKSIHSYSLDGSLKWKFTLQDHLGSSMFANDRYLVYNNLNDMIHCCDLENATVNKHDELQIEEWWVREIQVLGMEFGEITTYDPLLDPREYYELLILWSDTQISLLHANSGDEYWSLNFTTGLAHDPAIFFSRAESVHPEIESIYIPFRNNTIETYRPSGMKVWNASIPGGIILPIRMSDPKYGNVYANLFVTTDSGVSVFSGANGIKRSELEVDETIQSLTLSDEQLIISTGTDVEAYYNWYASSRDYSPNSAPFPSPLVPVLVSLFFIWYRKKAE